MEMTSSSVPVCRQGLFIHTGNPLMRDHPLSCERLLHVGQLNLTHSDIRYYCRIWQLIYLAFLKCFIFCKRFCVSSMGAIFGSVFLAFTSFWKSFGCSFNHTACLQVLTARTWTCAQTTIQSSASRSHCICSCSPLALKFKYSFSVGALPACSKVNESFSRGFSRVRLASSVPPPSTPMPCCFQLAAWKAGMILTLKPMSPIWQFGMSPSNLQEANATFISTAFPLMKYFQCSHTATSLVFAFKAVMWKFGLWFWYMHCSWICYEQNLYLNICYKLIIWKHRTPLFFCCCYKFNITRF